MGNSKKERELIKMCAIFCIAFLLGSYLSMNYVVSRLEARGIEVRCEQQKVR